ncbi:MAG: hypothetical protein R6X02_30050 [Enhygromyxa sp.]
MIAAEPARAGLAIHFLAFDPSVGRAAPEVRAFVIDGIELLPIRGLDLTWQREIVQWPALVEPTSAQSDHALAGVTLAEQLRGIAVGVFALAFSRLCRADDLDVRIDEGSGGDRQPSSESSSRDATVGPKPLLEAAALPLSLRGRRIRSAGHGLDVGDGLSRGFDGELQPVMDDLLQSGRALDPVAVLQPGRG